MNDNRQTLSVRKRIQVDGIGFSLYIYAVATESRLSEFVLKDKCEVSHKIDNTSLRMESIVMERKERVLPLVRVDSFNGSSFTRIHVA